jgi:hypothetical protein
MVQEFRNIMIRGNHILANFIVFGGAIIGLLNFQLYLECILSSIQKRVSY